MPGILNKKRISYLRNSLIKLFILLACSGFTVRDVLAQKFEFSGSRKRENISFKMIKNLMIIPLTINGKGPFNFVLDTGVGLILISDPKLIDSVSIKNLRSINILGLGEGETLSAFVTPSINLGFGSTKATNISAAILKKDIFELSNFVGMPVHGLIGYEFFNSFVVRINFITNILTIYSPETAYIPRKGVRIPISLEERKPYIFADIELQNGEKIEAKFIIDTGAGHPVSLETNGGVPFELPELRIKGNLGIGLTGPINGYIGRIKSIKLGKYTLQNVIAAFPNYEDVASRVFSINRNGNMGIAVLRRFNVVFDYNRMAMYVKPGPALKEPFEHDMAGMELSSTGKQFERILITRVEPNSAAADAGLIGGDEIVAINFKPVSEVSLTEIDNMFRSRSERSFIIDILPLGSKNKERTILTLKRRI